MDMEYDEPQPPQKPVAAFDTAALLASLGISRDDILDSAIDAISANILHEVKDAARSAAKDIARAEAKGVIQAALHDSVTGILHGNFQPVDTWGEPNGPPTTLRDMVKDYAITFMTEKVDERGEKSYHANMTRAQWYAKKAAEQAMDNEIRNELSKAVADAKSSLTTKVATFIAEKIAK